MDKAQQTTKGVFCNCSDRCLVMLGQIEGTSERRHGGAGWHGSVALRTIECLAATDDVVDAIHRILRVIVDETGIQCAGIRRRYISIP